MAKRQELKNRQRDAMLAGRPVQTVIEEAEPLIRQSSSRISCVREIPDLKYLDKLRAATKSHDLEPTNFKELEVESTQSKMIMDLSELHDLVGTSKNTPMMICHGIDDDTVTAILVDDSEFYDISLSSN